MTDRLRPIVKWPFVVTLRSMERRLLRGGTPLAEPPVFVLGVPRSGTTLLYQLLVHCFRVSYFCNAAERHASYAVTMTRMLRSRLCKHESDFSSNYGRTHGAAGPSEGLDIWHRWFPDTYVDEHHLSVEAVDQIRRTVAAVSAVLDAPFVNKDPHHCVRVRALNVVFPNCLFLYIDRNPVANAASILNVRRKRTAEGKTDLNTWISVKPREYASLVGNGYISDICGQVFCTSRNALDDLEAVAPGRHLVVSYEELCIQPRHQLARVTEFLRECGLEWRRRCAGPASFPSPDSVPIPEADRAALAARLDEMYKGADVLLPSSR